MAVIAQAGTARRAQAGPARPLKAGSPAGAAALRGSLVRCTTPRPDRSPPEHARSNRYSDCFVHYTCYSTLLCNQRFIKNAVAM